MQHHGHHRRVSVAPEVLQKWYRQRSNLPSDLESMGDCMLTKVLFLLCALVCAPAHAAGPPISRAPSQAVKHASESEEVSQHSECEEQDEGEYHD